MSSLAATQADGYFLSPAYFESGAYKKTGKNQWHKKTTSGGAEKARKRSADTDGPSSSTATTTVRFELPYAGRCQGCQAFISKGTRYNAVKADSKEKYHTTIIWEFRMSCRVPQCTQEFIIRTDPAEQAFSYRSGIQPKLRGDYPDTPDPNDDVVSISGARSTVSNPLDLLEKQKLNKVMALTERDQLEGLLRINQQIYSEDSSGNAAVRSTFRQQRKLRQLSLQKGQSLGWRKGMGLMLESTLSDSVSAKEKTFGPAAAVQQKVLFQQAHRSCIFDSTAALKTNSKGARKRPLSTALVGTERHDDDHGMQPEMVHSSGSVYPSPLTSCERARRRRSSISRTTVDLTDANDNHQACNLPANTSSLKPEKVRKMVVDGTQLRCAMTSSIVDSTSTGSTVHDLLAAYESDND